MTVFALTFIETFGLSIGVFASCCTFGGVFAGFVALCTRRSLEEVIAEAQLGAVAAGPSAFCVCIATAIIAGGS